MGTAYKLPRTIPTPLPSQLCYRDQNVDYGQPVGKRNAPRWLSRLTKHRLEAEQDSSKPLNQNPSGGRHRPLTGAS